MGQRARLALVAALFVISVSGFAAENTGLCAFAPVKTDPKAPDGFTPQQEVYLGDILADVGHMSAMTVDDDALNKYLTTIGHRLVKQLPPTNLNFRFYVADAPYANAFSIAGGRVYVTRKLIAFTRSEDELAGVMAHELGHIVTHQQAIMFTRIFKHQIGVTEFTDRKDLEEKFHRMLESNKSISIGERDEQEEADRVGLEILVRAGYRISALPDFFDRFSANKGKTGNWFTDTFGSTNMESKRYREMLKEGLKLLDQCIEKRDPASEKEFLKWRDTVVAYDRQNRPEYLPGLISKKSLDPPLQDQLHTLGFSPDGRYVIAQDNATIYVLTREPFQVKFKIAATDAYPAQITADSKHVTFYSSDLRAEVWDLDAKTQTAVYDVHSAFGCLQTALSRDAKRLACLDNKNNLVLIDAATQDRIFEKKQVRDADVGFSWRRFSYQLDYVNMMFSPDGKYLVISGKYGTMLVDVANQKEIPAPGAIKNTTKTAFVFLDDNHLFGLNDKAGFQASVVTFPQGEVQKTVEFAAAIPSPASKAGYVLMRPIKDYEVGVFDIKSGQIVRANKKPAMDVWGDYAVSELGTGEVGLFGSSNTPVARASLPRGDLAELRAFAVSDDFQWLALAEEERGAIWNLGTGQRLYNVKSFHGAAFGPDAAYVDFPKQEKMERSIAKLNLTQPGISLAAKLGPGRIQQRGRYVITWKKTDSDKPLDKEDTQTLERFNRYRYEGEHVNYEDVFHLADANETLTVLDSETGKELWSRAFDKNVPHAYTNADAGVIALVWRAGEPGAKAEFDRSPILAAKRDAAKYNNYLVEVVDLQSGEVVSGIVLETNDGMFSPKRVLATRDWAAIYDSYDRSLAYNLRTGVCTGKIFGDPVYIAPQSSQLVIKYDSRHFVVFDAATMTKTVEYTFSDDIDHLRLSPAGDRMFALGDTQTAYVVKTGERTQDISVQAK